MNEIIFDSNLFTNGMHLRGSTKTGANLSTTSERICNICGNYLGRLNCRILGKIKNPDTVIHCSWWEDKEKVKSIRGYRRIK